MSTFGLPQERVEDYFHNSLTRAIKFIFINYENRNNFHHNGLCPYHAQYITYEVHLILSVIQTSLLHNKLIFVNILNLHQLKNIISLYI